MYWAWGNPCFAAFSMYCVPRGTSISVPRNTGLRLIVTQSYRGRDGGKADHLSRVTCSPNPYEHPLQCWLKSHSPDAGHSPASVDPHAKMGKYHAMITDGISEITIGWNYFKTWKILYGYVLGVQTGYRLCLGACKSMRLNLPTERHSAGDAYPTPTPDLLKWSEVGVEPDFITSRATSCIREPGCTAKSKFSSHRCGRVADIERSPGQPPLLS